MANSGGLLVKGFVTSIPSQYPLEFQCKDCHNRAWESVREFMDQHLKMFCGRTADAESTLMPLSRSWLRESAADLATGTEDHCVMLFMVCPCLGILSASRTSFILNFVTNVLSDFPQNGICFLVKPNRAGQQGERRRVSKLNCDFNFSFV